MTMKRVIWHWTAGTHSPNATDKKSYHYLIAGDGTVTAGDFPVSANAGPLVSGKYAAHTAKCNTGSIGVAVCAMAGAVERPFSKGRYPITPAQVEALATLTARLCREYGIPVTRQTTLSHAEVQPTLGIPQAGKWDIRYLPGMTMAGDPVTVGDTLRIKVERLLQPSAVPQPETLLDKFIAWLRNLWRQL